MFYQILSEIKGKSTENELKQQNFPPAAGYIKGIFTYDCIVIHTKWELRRRPEKMQYKGCKTLFLRRF